MYMNIFRFFRSLKTAVKGLRYIFVHEQNFRIQVFAFMLVCVCIVIFPMRVYEVIVLFLVSILVLVLEILNTVLETFVDIIKPRLAYHVAVVKDMMAAMVLVASFGALVTGSIILLPYIFEIVVK
ncbi:MAG: hypothetical protein CL685_02690 [Candidatus Magasanikbacteria bacterium]|nr:hypothetical protein [Candidatus Magasanikbacteria bacterium]|tara:strand:- start:518 stop:892 length:375 start_codon:yes stop_codon:yes gene_type:complete